MYSIRFEWKSFYLNLARVDSYLNVLAEEGLYVGNSADTALTLWFTSEPSDEIKTAIQSYWDALTEASDEATSYVAADTITARVAELKEGLISKSWDEMSVAERKLVSQLPVSNAELGF